MSLKNVIKYHKNIETRQMIIDKLRFEGNKQKQI